MKLHLPSIEHVNVAGARVLLRVDLNVPVEGGAVTDRTRIERCAPTVRRLADRGARVILVSHFGRPKEPDRRYSLRPIAGELECELKRPVAFAPDCIGPVAQDHVASLADGSVALLENLRFHPGEERNDRRFARALADLADYYVNDAFSCVHRAHASTHAIAWELPAFAGLSLLAEIEALEAILGTPERPVMAIVGGSKVSTKLALLNNLIGKVERLAIGGGMANTFLAARRINVGTSLVEGELIETARAIDDKARRAGCEIILPDDAIVAETLEGGVHPAPARVDAIPADMMVLDIGPQSVAQLQAHLSRSRTLVWNGPLGAFEVEPFDAGTRAVAQAAARLTRERKLVSVAGGGDTVAALNAAGVRKDFTYVSTAGGAFLSWLEGGELPGIAALSQQAH